MSKEIEVCKGVVFVFYENDEVRLRLNDVFNGKTLVVTKEKLLELRAQIKFEPAKPKEEMFKGCYNE